MPVMELIKRKTHSSGSHNSLGTGAIIALGASVGGLVLIALLANLLCWRARRNRRAREANGVFDAAREFPYENQHRRSTSPVMKDSKSLYEATSKESAEVAPAAYVPTQEYAPRPTAARNNTARSAATRSSRGDHVTSPPTSPRRDKFGPAPIGAPVGDGAHPWVANTVETLYARPTTPGLYRSTSPTPSRRATSPVPRGSSGGARALSPVSRAARSTSPGVSIVSHGARAISPLPSSPLTAEFPRTRSPPTNLSRPPKAPQRVPRKKADSIIDGVEMVNGVPISIPSAPSAAHVRQGSSSS